MEVNRWLSHLNTNPTLQSFYKFVLLNGSKLTDNSPSLLVAECQHGADGLWVSLLHQKLDDGLAVGVNQVLALVAQGGGQICAHLLHSLNHLLLRSERDELLSLELEPILCLLHQQTSRFMTTLDSSSSTNPTSVV